MSRRIALLLVSLWIASTAAAEEYGWESFCHGYIFQALADRPVQGLDRTGLWLSWNETVRLTVSAGQLDANRFQAGRDAYAAQAAANDAEGIRETAGGKCGLGRNSLWRWW